jgi:hypothetical protein
MTQDGTGWHGMARDGTWNGMEWNGMDGTEWMARDGTGWHGMDSFLFYLDLI